MNSSFLNHVGRKGNICTVTYMHGDGCKDRFECVTQNDDSHFRNLTEEEQRIALRWLRYNVVPTKTPYEGRTSYGMKHVLEDRTKIYMTNNQFKEAMLVCGFYPVDTDELNWCFCISKLSPIFVDQADRKPGLPMLGDPMDYSEQEECGDHVGEWVCEHGSWVCDQCGRAPNVEDCWDYDEDEPSFAYCPHCGSLNNPDSVV
jgi:hypothetical protein